MKYRTKIVSTALAVLMLFSAVCAVFANQSVAASDYNWGTRHETAAVLSDQAKAYYDGEYSYETLSSQPADQLVSTLYTLMSETMTNSVSYSSLTSYWPYTDASNGQAGTLLFYSDTISSSFNREHVWPKSRASFHESKGGSDLHHLRPTNSTINSTRSNYSFGNVQGVISDYKTASYGGKTVLYYSSSNDLVEVNDNIKGDVARILLYVHIRWQQPNLFETVANPPQESGDSGGNNGKKVIESLDTLLEWMLEDPVDTWEMARNDMTEDIQGNRNAFIDYPELAWLIFDLDVPDGYQTPSGNGGTAVSPTPSPSSSASPSPSPSDSASPSPSPSDSASATPTSSATPTPLAGETGNYALVTELSSITDGYYVLYGVNGSYSGAMSNVCNSAKMEAVEVSVSNNTISNPDPSIVWRFTVDEGAISIYNEAAQSYVVINKSDSSGFALSNTASFTFSASVHDSQKNTFLLKTSHSSGRNISIYHEDFRAYNVSNCKELYLYKRVEADPTPSAPPSVSASPSPSESATPSAPPSVSASPSPGGTPNPPNLRGDVDCNGEVTAMDAAAVLRHIVRLITLEGQGLLNADADGSGDITASDAAAILRYVVRILPSL
ncbi:MAG: endonuclease [Clostridia bacterium]|nr:endonuclease [Clostridia bacterium]